MKTDMVKKIHKQITVDEKSDFDEEDRLVNRVMV